MSQNKNTPCQVEYGISGMQQACTGISIFNLQQNEQDVLEQGKSERRNTFSAFINSRNQYLNRLAFLGNNWISGSSKQPTEQSIHLSKELLNNIGNWYTYEGYREFVYPKVLMSPTPAGGIAMEIEIFPSMRAFVSVLDENINYEVEQDGNYVEFQATKDNISNQLLNLYTSNERRYNSGW